MMNHTVIGSLVEPHLPADIDHDRMEVTPCKRFRFLNGRVSRVVVESTQRGAKAYRMYVRIIDHELLVLPAILDHAGLPRLELVPTRYIYASGILDFRSECREVTDELRYHTALLVNAARKTVKNVLWEHTQHWDPESRPAHSPRPEPTPGLQESTDLPPTPRDPRKRQCIGRKRWRPSVVPLSPDCARRL